MLVTPAEWVTLIVAVGGLAGLVKAFAEVFRSLRSMTRKLDAVHHETTPNTGSSLHDVVMLEMKPRLEQLVVTAGDLSDQLTAEREASAERRRVHDLRLESQEKSLRGTQRDVGRIADGVVHLSAVDREDRERAQREHAEIRSDVARVEGALSRHIADR